MANKEWAKNVKDEEGTDGCGPDGEGDDVGDWRDGDGDAGVTQRQGDALRDRALLVLAAQIVQRLYDDEHVVDADAQQ